MGVVDKIKSVFRKKKEEGITEEPKEVTEPETVQEEFHRCELPGCPSERVPATRHKYGLWFHRKCLRKFKKQSVSKLRR